MLLTGVVFIGGGLAQAQIHVDESANFHNTAFVETDEQIDALFFEAATAAERDRPADALRLLERVLAQSPRALVRRALQEHIDLCIATYERHQHGYGVGKTMLSKANYMKKMYGFYFRN